jgi:hypothetical protein
MSQQAAKLSQQAAEASMNWFRREGLFAPVTEEVTAFDLPVNGHASKARIPTLMIRYRP